MRGSLKSSKVLPAESGQESSRSSERRNNEFIIFQPLPFPIYTPEPQTLRNRVKYSMPSLGRNSPDPRKEDKSWIPLLSAMIRVEEKIVHLNDKVVDLDARLSEVEESVACRKWAGILPLLNKKKKWAYHFSVSSLSIGWTVSEGKGRERGEEIKKERIIVFPGFRIVRYRQAGIYSSDRMTTGSNP